MSKSIRILCVLFAILHVTGIPFILTAQESPSPRTIFDSVSVQDGIPFDAAKLYLQNFFRTPWYAAPSGYRQSLTDNDSTPAPATRVTTDRDNSFSMEWKRSAQGYYGSEETPFVTYSRTSVALGTASAVAIWGTLAAQAWQEKNTLNFAAASAAAALNIYQGLKLWKNVSVKPEVKP